MACTFLSQGNKNQHAKKYSDMPVHTQRSFQHSNKHGSAGLQAVDLVLSKVDHLLQSSPVSVRCRHHLFGSQSGSSLFYLKFTVIKLLV